MNEADEVYITKSKLAQFFKSSAYSFKTTAANNFFTVFDDLFLKLDHEEELEEEVGVNHIYAPRFGDADSTQEQVFAFYDEWKFFVTKK